MCDEVIGSSSTSSPTANSYCGDDAIGYTEVCEDDEYRYIISSGAPDHEAEYDQVKANPNTRCKYIPILTTLIPNILLIFIDR